MKICNVFFLIISISILFSCRAKKEIIKKETITEQTDTKTIDTVIMRQRIINPDSIKFQTELDLNKLDLFKGLFNQLKPHVSTDSTGQVKISTWIDNDNKLRQKVTVTPKGISVTDTTKVSIEKTNTKIEKTKEETQIIEKQPNFFERLWLQIKGFAWISILVILVFVAIKIFRK